MILPATRKPSTDSTCGRTSPANSNSAPIFASDTVKTFTARMGSGADSGFEQAAVTMATPTHIAPNHNDGRKKRDKDECCDMASLLKTREFQITD
jgi:hypothetical protein